MFIHVLRSFRSSSWRVFSSILILGAAMVLRCLWTTHNDDMKKRQQLSQRSNKNNELEIAECNTSFDVGSVPNQIDLIVIGSSLSGLCCAALIARTGKVVVVLEQRDTIGGSFRTVSDQDWEFDLGCDGVGDVGKCSQLIDLATDGSSINWHRVGWKGDGHIYSDVRIASHTNHSLRAGKKDFLDDLVQLFPGDKEGLHAYAELCEECLSVSEEHLRNKLLPKWIQLFLQYFKLEKRYEELAKLTTQDVLDCYFSSPDLKAILSYRSSVLGISPGQESFVAHGTAMAHRLNGIFYPMGGMQAVTTALVKTIMMNSGRVFLNCQVDELVYTSDGRAIDGVRLRDQKEYIHAAAIVSATNVIDTERLVFKNADMMYYPIIHPDQEALLGDLCLITALIGIDGDSRKLRLKPSSLFISPQVDIASHLSSYYVNPLAELSKGKLCMSIVFPSLMDRSFKNRFPGKITCVVRVPAKLSWFDQFKVGKPCKLPKEYHSFMLQFKNFILSQIYKQFPQINGRVRYCNLISPLSGGQSLSTAVMKRHLTQGPLRYTTKRAFRPRTDISGLWLTGHAITFNGFEGAIFGGLLTAESILGYGTVDLLIRGAGLVNDIEPPGKLL